MPIEMLDNTEGKRLGDSLRAVLDDEAKLSIISAHVSCSPLESYGKNLNAWIPYACCSTNQPSYRT